MPRGGTAARNRANDESSAGCEQSQQEDASHPPVLGRVSGRWAIRFRGNQRTQRQGLEQSRNPRLVSCLPPLQPYPGVREQGRRHLVGPVLAALRAWDPVVGLVVGSYQGCSEELHALAREVAEERARTEWRQMGARSEHEALGIFVHDVHRRWGSVFWRSWARVIRGRLPAIGRPNADILNHGPPPAYARGQAAVGGAEPWPRVQPGVLRGLRAAAGL